MNLRKDLNRLQEAGIIDEQTRVSIEAYYANEKKGSMSLLYVFAVLGAILCGMGLILLFAHNWDNFSKTVKIGLALIPLLLSQSACVFILIRKERYAAWRESAAVFLFFAVVTALALMSQIYHIEGTVSELLFTWMLLTLPVIYFMQSGWVSVLFIVVNTWFGVADEWGAHSRQEYFYWILLAGVVPFYLQLCRQHTGALVTRWHHWMLALSVSITLMWLGQNNSVLLLPAYFGMAALMVLSRENEWFARQDKWVNGYYWTGLWLTRILLIIASFSFYWDSLYNWKPVFPDVLYSMEAIAAILFMAAAAWRLYSLPQAGTFMMSNPMRWVFVAFAVMFLSGLQMQGMQLWANVLVLGVGVKTIQEGMNEDKLAVLNSGILLIAALVCCRFFDTHLSYLLRAIMFLITGAGFLVLNYQQLKKRKEKHEN